MNKKMKELQPDNRPDEKFLHLGPAALTEAELLAIILRTGTKEEHSVQLAEEILCKNELSGSGGSSEDQRCRHCKSFTDQSRCGIIPSHCHDQ